MHVFPFYFVALLDSFSIDLCRLDVLRTRCWNTGGGGRVAGILGVGDVLLKYVLLEYWGWGTYTGGGGRIAEIVMFK